METGMTRNKILAELSKSPHGDLKEYIPVGLGAAEKEPEFLAHLIAWDKRKGQVRDAKIGLPVVSLMNPKFPEELAENSLAHLALLGPRELLRAYRFVLEVKPKGRIGQMKRLMRDWLYEKEADHRRWNRLAVQHRATLKEMYALPHVKPGAFADRVLFKNERPLGSIFDVIARLGDMSVTDAAGEIVSRKIPFLVAKGALGAKAKEPDLVLALINAMTPSELVTNTKSLQKLGVQTNPALRGAFEAGLARAADSSKNVLKATAAIEAEGMDETLQEKLRGLQERQLKKVSVEGNWLVLADKSSSMSTAIETSRQVAATLAKLVKGKVYLVFFDTQPITVDVTGLTLDQIKKATEHIRADGCTSIGVGLNRMLLEKIEVDGIAIISDGEENTAPMFANVYPKYAQFVGKEPPVYLYHCGNRSGNFTYLMRQAQIEMQTFDLGNSVDYYSLPNLVQTMRTNQYSLVDEVMETPLLKLTDVLKPRELAVA